ncbi:hypothetical protein ACKWTF_015529 [Chironomus riparius]
MDINSKVNLEELEMPADFDIEEDSRESELDKFSCQKLTKSQQPIVTSTEKSPKKQKDLLTLFNDYLIGDGAFNFNVVSITSGEAISSYLRLLLEYFYNHFNEVYFCKEVLYMIHRKSRYTVQGKVAFSDASRELFEQEFSKILNNPRCNDVVMFGALLCELMPYNKPDHFEITKQLNVWIMQLVNCSSEGNENSLIAFMLILWRLSKIFNPLSGSYRQLLKVLRILLKDGDSERKKLEVSKVLDQASYLNLEDYQPLSSVKYKKQTENSPKCKEFEKFITVADDHALFNVAMFTDITDNEIEFCARKFVEVGIQEPQKMKYLAYTANRFQQVITHIRRVAEIVMKSINQEFEVIRKNEGKGSIQVINLAKFIGECYMYEDDLIPASTITKWLSLLSDLGDTGSIVTTLKLCGYIYEARDQKNYEKFMEPLGVKGTEVKDEIKRIEKQFNEDDVESYVKYQESRRFQPAQGARMIENFSLFLTELLKDKNVDFDYLSLYEFNNHIAAKALMRELARPTTNVIKLAQFFKTFFEFSVKLGKFVINLKSALLNKIADIPVDRPQEMIRVGQMIGELRNLTIIEKYPQDKWLDMIESLKPKKHTKILEIQLEVLKVMMYNLYIHEEGRYMKYLEYIKHIDTSDPKYSPKIKSNILQIIRNSINKKFDKPSKVIFIKMKLGCKFHAFPLNIPDSSPIDFDLHDFVKFYFLTASNNPFFIDNYLKSKKLLSNGQQGRSFGIILNKLIFDRFKSITDTEYFDEHEAISTLQFILSTNSTSIYRENSIATFLQNILEFEDFEAHKDCLRTLVQLLKMAKFNAFARADSRDIFCLFRKVQAKFNKIEDSEAEDDEEVEVWHIVDYQSYPIDQSEPESIEPSQLIWQATEKYRENQQKIQKMVENSKKPSQNVDSLAQNFKDWTKNFHQIQNSGRSSRQLYETQYDQNAPSLNQNESNLIKNDQKSAKTDQNLVQECQKSDNLALNFSSLSQNSRRLAQNAQKSFRNDQNSQNSSQVSTNYTKRSQRIDKRSQKPKIEWNVTRDDLKERSDLRNDDLPNIRKRFDHKSPLYQGSSHSGRNSDETLPKNNQNIS